MYPELQGLVLFIFFCDAEVGSEELSRGWRKKWSDEWQSLSHSMVLVSQRSSGYVIVTPCLADKAGRCRLVELRPFSGRDNAIGLFDLVSSASLFSLVSGILVSLKSRVYRSENKPKEDEVIYTALRLHMVMFPIILRKREVVYTLFPFGKENRKSVSMR